jgi:REP element-mobilizing transposase RayT
MARQARIEFPGALHHVISRGIERRRLFADDIDRRKYIAILERAVGRLKFKVYAYCLMDNHVHLAIESGAVPLSRVMRSINTAYAGFFNARHRRSGYLFQGRYKGFLVDREEYLLSLVRYIHENPVKAGIAAHPGEYGWSSHRAYMERAPAWLSADTVLERFGRRRTVAKRNFASFFGQAEEAPYGEASRFVQTVVGDEEFARDVLGVPRTAEITVKRVKPADLVDWVASEMAIKPTDLRGPSREREVSASRSICAILGRDIANLPIAAIAREVNRAQSSLWRNVQFFESALTRDRRLGQRVRRLEASCREWINNA